MKKSSDPRGGHIRLYWALVDSMAWRALGWADQGLYIAMRRKLGATNNGNIEATLGGSNGGMRHFGITSSASLSKGLRALMAVGLIAKTRQGHLSQGRRTCNLFRFTDEPVLEMPKLGIAAMKATNEWRDFATLAAAKAAILSAHKAAKTGEKRPPKNALSVQPLKGATSDFEPATVKTGSTTEHGDPLPIRKLNMVETADSRAKITDCP